MAPLLTAILMTSTNSYSSTGGNTAGAGGTVTQGASESSSYSENIVGGSDGGSSATIHIETDSNGVKREETVTQAAPPGGNLELYLATSSGSGSADVGSSIQTGVRTDVISRRHAVRIPDHRITREATSTATTSAMASARSTPAVPASGSFFAALWKRIAGLFGFGQ